MKIDEKAESEAFDARFHWDERRWEAWLARAEQPVRVSREALCRALNDKYSPDVSFADITETALRALGIEVTDK